MERIHADFITGRKPLAADEYMKDGLIYCKNCNTAREFIYENRPIRLMCDCQRQAVALKEREKAENERLTAIERMRNNNIQNDKYRTFTFANDDGRSQKNLEIAKRYVKNFEDIRGKGLGLMFWGDVGTGKTYLALSIANALIDKGIDAYHTTLARIVETAQDFRNAENSFEKLMSRELIVIDDLGTERSTSFAFEQIYKFIDRCTVNNIPLITTTNYMPSELEEKANDSSNIEEARVYSRILEKCVPVKVSDIKRRAENAEKNKAEIKKILGIA